jgi:hypothetical protein
MEELEEELDDEAEEALGESL